MPGTPVVQTPDPRLDQARALVREKGLTRQDLRLLEDLLREAGPGPDPLALAVPAPAEPQLERLRATLGLFLAFLDRVKGHRPGEQGPAMGLVLQHSLAGLGEAAAAAHRELLALNHEPAWTVQLLDLIAVGHPDGGILGEAGEQF